MRRRGQSSTFANPVLVGAVTVLVVVVAVFLAYNANRGLPFVPTLELRFQAASAAALTEGNEVLEGGKRIGFVDELRPIRRADGRAVAQITVKLDAGAGDIPTDSRVAIRPRSLTGLKYIELTRGTRDDALGSGDTIPVDQSRVPVQIDDVQGMYDAPTRLGYQRVLTGGGAALAGRGAGLNATIAELPRLLRHLEPVARTLADPRTGLEGFLRNVERTVSALAPVADRYAHGFSAGARAFEAWSRNADALGEAQEQSRLTLLRGLPALRAQRPFAGHLESFSVALRGAAEVMPRALPPLEAALARGVPVQRDLPALNRQLEPTLVALQELAQDPDTPAALRGLEDTVGVLAPITRFVGPYVTVCNYVNYGFGNAADAGGEPALGLAQRTLVNFGGPDAPDGILNLGRPTPAQNLHVNYLPAAIDAQGNADCESGQRGYLQRVARATPPGTNIVIDPATPGNQGPTYTGRRRVPEGQTFSRRPEFGPAFPAGADG